MTTKVCKTCHEEKTHTDFSEDRNECKKCRAYKSRLYHQARGNRPAAENGNRIFPNLHEARRGLIINVIYRAFRDGCGEIDSNDVKLHKQEGCHELIMDGKRFFKDGRFQRFAELIDICPDMEPEWDGKNKNGHKHTI